MAVLDYEGTVHLAFLPRADLDCYNLVASFRDTECAAVAAAQLREQGIPAGDISWLGHMGDTVHTGTGMTRSDERMVVAVTRDATVGGVLGGLAGAALGLIPTLALAGATLGAEVAVVGGLFGLISGGLLGGELGLDRRQAGSDTYDDQVEDGITLIGVHTSRPQDATTALDLLQRCGPIGIRTFAPGEEPCIA